MDLIGFIGLGKMGLPMASNLARKGASVITYDVRREPMLEVAKLGGTCGDSVSDVAARAGVVFTMLPNSSDVDAVITGPNGVLESARPGSVVVDMSTIDPRVTDKIAAAAAAKRIGFVDAPVGRLSSHAERGESLFMVGGAPEDFARVKPLLEMMGTTIHHCGAVGTGMRTKLVNNFLAIVSCQMNAEAIALSQRFGCRWRKRSTSFTAPRPRTASSRWHGPPRC
ncbi:MAG: NAD(P)-dependent oxidoreductase [bacterium]